MNWVIRGIIVVLVAACGVGAALGQERPWQDLEVYSAWAKDARAFYAYTQSVSTEIEFAEARIDDYVAGAVSAAEMQAEVAATLSQTDGAIDEIAAVLADGMERPSLQDPQLRRVADTFAGYLETIDGELREQHRTTRALLNAALAGDWDAYEIQTARSLRLAAKAIRSEATVQTAAMQMQDRASPTHALSRSIIAFHEPTAVQLELLAAYVDGQSVDIGESYTLVEGSIFTARQAIEDGEAATESMHRQAAAARNDASVNPAVGEFLSRVAASYDRSFGIERRILATLSEFQHLMLGRIGAAEPLDDATVGRMSELAVALDHGVAERYVEQNGRLADLQSLAVAMQR